MQSNNPSAARRNLSVAISRMVPKVISGAQLSFVSEKAVTHCQLHVLMTIYARPSISMRDLSRRLHVQMPTVTGIVGRLEKAGLVRRSRSEADRRKVSVALTSQGTSFIGRFQRSIAERWEVILGFLDAEDVRTYQRLIEKIERGFRSENGR